MSHVIWTEYDQWITGKTTGQVLLYTLLTNPSALKLYCGYKYTRPCMINHIGDLKQLYLQVNGHAWFHLHEFGYDVRNGEGAKNSKYKYLFPADSNPSHAAPRQANQRFRPLGHDALMMISGLKSYRIVGYKLIKPLYDNTCQIDNGYMCIWTHCQAKSTFLISM